jgi:hypothetical protein
MMDKAMSAALMADFTSEQIGHKPATWCKACAAAVRNKTGKSCPDHRVIKCAKCKTNVTEAHTCLDFVGHADVRARLCEADPEWTWAPFDFPGSGSLILSDGHPVGLWITLTVGGVSKPGYGSVDKGKPEAMKELIGDALRNAGLSFGIAWKLWAKGERSSGEGEGGQSGASGDAWDNGTPARNSNGQQRPQGQVSRPGREAAAEASGEPDPDAQQYADKGSQARTVAEVEQIHKKAREAGKIGAVIRAPESGKAGKLAVYLDWKRKQLADADKAWNELNDAARGARMDIGELEVFVKQATGADMESASAAQLRQAAAKLRERAA